MTVKEIQEKIDGFHYWDARVLYLDCNHFADEIALGYKYEGNTINYNFIGCYKSIFDHIKKYDKLRPVKEMTVSQIVYFLQSVEVGETIEEGVRFFKCKIGMFPLEVEIWCKDIQVTKQKRSR